MGNRRKVDRASVAKDTLGRARAGAIGALRFLAFAVLLLAVCAGGYAGFVAATESPRLAIASIEVAGNSRVATETVVRESGLAPGQNLFRCDTGAAEKALLQDPWIERAHVDRVFPQGIAIRVLERAPVALVDVGHLYLVDGRGEVFKRLDGTDKSDLPVITGIPREAFSERLDDARDDLGEALSLLGTFSDSPLSHQTSVSEVHLDAAEGPTLYLGESSLEVKLGHGAFGRKLDRLSRVLAEAARRGQQLSLVRLDNRARPGWIAARPRAATE